MIRRDVIEERENSIKWSLVQKFKHLAYQPMDEHKELSFTFTVINDDGNLLSALVAGGCDLLKQSDCMRDTTGSISSCLMLLTNKTEEHDEGWVVDPSNQESLNLSNNFVLVTVVKENKDDIRPKVILEKGNGFRSTFTAPAISHGFKSSTITLSQFREAAGLGRQTCLKAIE